MTMKRLALVLILALLWPATAVPSAMAEVFVLNSGGRVTGQWINRDESPRKTYVVKLAGGGQLTLQKSQVKQVLRARPEQLEYERIRPSYPDTVEGLGVGIGAKSPVPSGFRLAGTLRRTDLERLPGIARRSLPRRIASPIEKQN